MITRRSGRTSQNAEPKNLETTVAPAFNAHLVAAQTLLDKLPK